MLKIVGFSLYSFRLPEIAVFIMRGDSLLARVRAIGRCLEMIFIKYTMYTFICQAL